MTADDRSWARGGLSAEVRAALASGLPASEVWSLLLGVMEARASERTHASLRGQWGRDRFVEPCYLDQRTFIEMDRQLLAAAAEFESIELSPVAPLGVCSAVALASQNKIVSTTRGTEVVSDPTNVLALECARRLQQDPQGIVRLVTSHRTMRAQAVPKLPGYAAHFRMLCLASAGHERENRAFFSGELARHITTHFTALDRLEADGYSFASRRLRLLATPASAELAERVGTAVLGTVSEGTLTVEHAPLDHAYYDTIRFMVFVTAPNGVELPLIDGGGFDWLRKLMSNGKMVYVASGMGSQVAAYLFRREGAGAACR
jgi:hypothetical protein